MSPIERKIEEFKLILSKKSYYNAAEGRNYNEEKVKRDTCSRELRTAAAELRSLGVDPVAVLKSSNFLVSEGELK